MLVTTKIQSSSAHDWVELGTRLQCEPMTLVPNDINRITAFLTGIFWLHFYTVRKSRELLTIFIYIRAGMWPCWHWHDIVITQFDRDVKLSTKLEAVPGSLVDSNSFPTSQRETSQSYSRIKRGERLGTPGPLSKNGPEHVRMNVSNSVAINL